MGPIRVQYAGSRSSLKDQERAVSTVEIQLVTRRCCPVTAEAVPIATQEEASTTPRDCLRYQHRELKRRAAHIVFRQDRCERTSIPKPLFRRAADIWKLKSGPFTRSQQLAEQALGKARRVGEEGSIGSLGGAAKAGSVWRARLRRSLERLLLG